MALPQGSGFRQSLFSMSSTMPQSLTQPDISVFVANRKMKLNLKRFQPSQE